MAYKPHHKNLFIRILNGWYICIKELIIEFSRKNFLCSRVSQVIMYNDVFDVRRSKAKQNEIIFDGKHVFNATSSASNFNI